MSFHYERLECESVNQIGGSNFFLLLRTIRMQKMCHSQHFFTWVVDFCYIEDCITFGRRCSSAAFEKFAVIYRRTLSVVQLMAKYL